jgi:superfamily II DNA or RNA helicase
MNGGQVELFCPEEVIVGSAQGAPVLRDYQREAIDRVMGSFGAGVHRVLFQLPTGSGKTVIAADLIRRFEAEGKRSLFIAPRRELIEQTSAGSSMCWG